MARFSKSIITSAVFSAALMVGSTGATAATVTSITPGAVALGDTIGARFRGQSTGNEHYAGVNDLGTGANRSEAGITWAPGTYGFTFGYDSATGTVSSTINGISSLTYAGPAGMVTDQLVFQLSNRSKNTATFSLANLTVNGEAAGGLTCSAFCEWSVTDFAAGPQLSVTGDLTVAGQFSSNDSERVKFQIAANTVAAVPVPAALPLLLAGLGGLGYVARRRKGA